MASALPSPETYEQEYVYWPWGKLIELSIDLLARRAPSGGCVVDYMCGTGYLLGQLRVRRPDLQLFGCSLEPIEYLNFGRRKYAGVSLIHADALEYVCPIRPDVAVCTGGIHHLRRCDREAFLVKVVRELATNAWFLVGEPVIQAYTNEIERRLAVVNLNAELMRYAITRDAPEELLDVATSLLRADILKQEKKLTLDSLLNLLKRHLPIAELFRVWPETDIGFGDMLLVCGPTSIPSN